MSDENRAQDRIKQLEQALRSVADAGNDIAEMAEAFVTAGDVKSLRNYGASIASIARHALGEQPPGPTDFTVTIERRDGRPPRVR